MNIAPAIGILYKLKNKLDTNSKLMIYTSLIEPHLNYLAIVYAPNIYMNTALKEGGMSTFSPRIIIEVKKVMVKHEIDTGEARPRKQAPRNKLLAKRNEVKEQVEEMKRSGVIEPSSGPWSSP